MIYSNFKMLPEKDGYLFATVDVTRSNGWFGRATETELISRHKDGGDWFFVSSGSFCRQLRSSCSPINPLERAWYAQKAMETPA